MQWFAIYLELTRGSEQVKAQIVIPLAVVNCFYCKNAAVNLIFDLLDVVFFADYMAFAVVGWEKMNVINMCGDGNAEKVPIDLVIDLFKLFI